MQKVVFTILFACSLQFSARSQAAFFDKTFGNDGFFETDFGYSEIGQQPEMRRQPDGKILVRINQADHFLTSKKRIVRLARFLPDGGFDPDFGDGGSITLLDTVDNSGSAGTKQLVLLSDGKILTAFSRGTNPNVTTAILKFDSAGKPDSTFGKNGKLVFKDEAHCSALIRLPNGKLLLGYYSFGEVGFRAFNANGSLPNGSAVNWSWTDPAKENLEQWIPTPDNHVLACGRVVDHDAPGKTYDAFFGKYDANGWAGGNFGDFGTLRQDLSGDYDFATDLQLLPDGKILSIGSANGEFFLARHLANGYLDPSFQTDGKRIFNQIFPDGVLFHSPVFSKMAADQTVVAAADGGSNLLAGIFRFKTDGSLDSSFNNGKLVIFPTNNYVVEQISTLPDRRILTCGVRREGSNSQFFIARLLPEADAVAWFRDADGDGFGSAAEVQFSVGQPTGFVNSYSDCDDSNAQIFPGATEICNGKDDNCDGKTDEIPAVACQPQLELPLGADGKVNLDFSKILIADPNLPCWDANANFEIDQNSFDCSKIGQQTVKLTATSMLGGTNQCQTTVKVVDNLPPTARCSTDLKVVLDDTGLFNLSPILVDAGSTDNCEIALLTVQPNQFSSANLGKNTVVLTATDASGNSSTCSTTVEISQLIGTSELAFSKSDFQILPNPASDFLTLKIGEQVDFKHLRLEILDLQGRVLTSKNEASGGRVFATSVQNLAAGRYFLRVVLDSGALVFDFEKLP